MKAGDVLTLAVVGAGAYAAYRAIKAGTDAAATAGQWLQRAGDTVGAAYDAVTDTLSAPFVAVRDSNIGRIVGANVSRPAVPIGGQSVQQTHVTDLPEGSYQAANMFWALHPNDVFYD